MRILIYLFTVAFACLCSGQSFGQSIDKIERTHIGPAGGTQVSPSGRLKVSHSIGGIMTRTGRGNRAKFTQGFQQPEICSDCDTTSGPPTLTISCDNLYNIITPNQDGSNDAWIVEELADFPNPNAQIELKIFTRWGQEVFATPAYKNEWIGQDKNNAILPNGTYYYLLIYDPEKEPCKGHITVLK